MIVAGDCVTLLKEERVSIGGWVAAAGVGDTAGPLSSGRGTRHWLVRDEERADELRVQLLLHHWCAWLPDGESIERRML